MQPTPGRDLLYAYIGMGQYIDPQAGERASYTWTLEQARKDNNAEAVKELEALQPYPGDFAIERIDGERKWAVHYGRALFIAIRMATSIFISPASRRSIYRADRQAWGDGSAYTVEDRRAATRSCLFRETES